MTPVEIEKELVALDTLENTLVSFLDKRIGASELLKSEFDKLKSLDRYKQEYETAKPDKIIRETLDSIDFNTRHAVNEEYGATKARIARAKTKAKKLYSRYHPDTAPDKSKTRWFDVLRRAANSGSIELIHCFYILADVPDSEIDLNGVRGYLLNRRARVEASAPYRAYSLFMSNTVGWPKLVDARILSWIRDKGLTILKGR
jgi:hypothetical protein